MYDLYGVLVHHGHSVHSGHYLSYVRNASGLWHICDDTRVAQVRGRKVQAVMRGMEGIGPPLPPGPQAPSSPSLHPAAGQ